MIQKPQKRVPVFFHGDLSDPHNTEELFRGCREDPGHFMEGAILKNTTWGKAFLPCKSGAQFAKPVKDLHLHALKRWRFLK